MSLEPAGITILARYPSSGVSNPIVALSVSISAKRSPSANWSPEVETHKTHQPVDNKMTRILDQH